MRLILYNEQLIGYKNPKLKNNSKAWGYDTVRILGEGIFSKFEYGK